MARDVSDDTYYITSGGKIPVRWTAPEVWVLCIVQGNNKSKLTLFYNSHYFIESTHLRVMCGVLDV